MTDGGEDHALISVLDSLGAVCQHMNNIGVSMLMWSASFHIEHGRTPSTQVRSIFMFMMFYEDIVNTLSELALHQAVRDVHYCLHHYGEITVQVRLHEEYVPCRGTLRVVKGD